MIYNLLISPIAKAEIIDTTKWYNKQKNTPEEVLKTNPQQFAPFKAMTLYRYK